MLKKISVFHRNYGVLDVYGYFVKRDELSFFYGKFVYKVVDGLTQSCPIEVFRLNNGTEYVVESGLEVGEVIVAEGAGLLRDGIAINLENTENTENTENGEEVSAEPVGETK